MQRVSILNPDLTLTLSQRPVPEPGPGEVLVRVKSVGVCGSDNHSFEHGRIADFVVEGPLVLGHEASGVVEGLGDGVQDLAKARVAMEPGVPCGACHECRSGRYNLCPDVSFRDATVDGACEYVVLPRAVHPVPAHVSFDAAALVEPLSVGFGHARKPTCLSALEL